MSDSLRETVNLLRDDSLPWPDDLDIIRKPLAALLVKIEQTPSHQFDDEVEAICYAIIKPDEDAVLNDPLQAWIESSARQLNIISYTASHSHRMADALKRLFGHL